MIPRPGTAGAGTPATTQRSLFPCCTPPPPSPYTAASSPPCWAPAWAAFSTAPPGASSMARVSSGAVPTATCAAMCWRPATWCRCSAMCSAAAAAVTAARSSPPATRWVKRWPRWCSCRCCCAMISPSGPSKPGPWPACCWPAPSRTWRGTSSPTALSRSALCFLSSPCFLSRTRANGRWTASSAASPWAAASCCWRC